MTDQLAEVLLTLNFSGFKSEETTADWLGKAGSTGENLFMSNIILDHVFYGIPGKLVRSLSAIISQAHTHALS